MAAVAWLQRQRKSDLIELAGAANFSNPDGMLKEDLANALDDHLRKNATRLSSKSALAPYYDRASPVKESKGASTATTDAESKAKSKARRTTKAKDELEASDDKSQERSLVARTPKAVQRVAQRVPMSPAVLTDAVERQSAIVRAKVSNYAAKSGVKEFTENLRETLSSVIGIELMALFVESWGLSREVLPWRHILDFPANRVVGSPALPVSLPDLFYLLTGSFWSATTLWASTSLAVPLVLAYFFNLTLKTKTSHGGVSKKPLHQFDPLTFNVAKALVSWLVYAQGMRFSGFVAEGTVHRVNAALPGGYQGVLIGSGIGVLASIYDAVLRK